MSFEQDLRENPSHSGILKALQEQWPTDPFRPSPWRSQVSGIDCLAILYRFLYASLPRGHWPPVEPEGAANQAILRYFWADFGHMESDDGQSRGQLRQAALSQIQSTLQGPNVDFAALCESPAMMDVMWARYAFRFYGTPWSRLKGDDIWVKQPDMYDPVTMANFGRLDWNPDKHPTLQELVDQKRVLTSEKTTEERQTAELKCTINEPLVVQVRLVVGQGVRVSLHDARRFTAVTTRPRDGAAPVEGTTNVYVYDTDKTYGYVLTAVVHTRTAAFGADYDTIRLFDTDGRECVPTNTARATGGESWRGDIKAALPQGQMFLLFYLRVSEFTSDSLFCAAPGVAPRVLTALVDRKLAEDQDWFQNVSDDEGEQSDPGPALASV